MFTIGNLITLGLVALALMLYKIADSKNRSLEKVKKYAEKCKEDIARYAEEKGMQVKNFGIDLDVEKKSAAQYLKNIQKLNEEELAKKSQSVAKIENQIKSFENSLSELYGMTDRVQENLARIRDESVFVENTGRRVTEAKEKFEQVEKAVIAAQKSLEAAENALEKKNAEILEKTAREVLTSAKSIVSDFEATARVIERKVEDHKTILLKAEKEREAVLARDLDTVKKTLRDVIESAGRRAGAMEEAAFVKLREQAQERVNQVKAFFEEKIKTSQETLKSEQSSINEKLKNIHDKWNEVSSALAKEKEAVNASLIRQQEDWKRNVLEFKTLTDKQRKELETSITASKQELNASLAELKSKSAAALKQQETESDELINKINASIAELQSLAKNIQKQQQDELNAVLSDMRKKTETAVAKQQAELSTMLKDAGEKTYSAISNQRNTVDSALKDHSAKVAFTVTNQKNELDSILKDLKEKTNTAISREQSELDAAIKEIREKSSASIIKQQSELESALKNIKEITANSVNKQQSDLAATLKDIKDKTDFAVANQETNLTAELKKQMENWQELCRDTERDIIAKTESRLEEYGAKQAEAVKQLSSLADDASRLDKELRKLMQDSVAKVNASLGAYEKETEAGMEKTAAKFNAQAQAFKTQLEEMNKELNKIKQHALDNTAKKLTGFEKEFASDLAKRAADIGKQIDSWQDSMEQKLEKSAAKITAGWQKAEEKLNLDRAKTVASLGEKLTADLAKLKAETSAIEKGIRDEMRAVDQTRAAFAEQANKDIAEIRLTAENEVKNQIGQYQLGLQDALRQKQRELEKELQEISEKTKTAYGALEEAAVKTRETYDEWQSSYNNRMREMDNSLETIRRQSRETAGENDERIAQFRQNLEDIRKEMNAQKKLFDQNNAVKTELQRGIEEMNSDLARLEQRKSEISQLETQFAHIKRLVEDESRKMQSFLSEKHKFEIMQKDFDRLVKISQAVEDKLAQVSTSDDILTNVQVQIRKLEDSLKSTEDKFNKIERKNEVLEQTNDGIDRNFKALQETEAAIKNAEKVINAIADQFDSTRVSIEALSKESLKAKDAAEKIEILDEALSKIEKRIQEMNVAREWLARTETELKNLDKDLQTQVKIAKDLAKKGGGKFAPAPDKDKGGSTPQDRDNALRLRNKGWTIEDIANALNLSKGEVELIIEIGSRG